MLLNMMSRWRQNVKNATRQRVSEVWIGTRTWTPCPSRQHSHVDPVCGLNQEVILGASSRPQTSPPVSGTLGRAAFVRYNNGQMKDIPMAHEPTRTARLEARIAPEALAIVKRAAQLQGRSVSDFIVAAASEAAHRVIEETQVIRLSAEDQQRFVELLLNPPPPAPALERAEKAHAELFGS
jgi:uncharacterized protein (DUF1778 family)